MGNPETDEFHDWEGIVDYAWTHTIISNQMYNMIKSICNFKLFNWTDECTKAIVLLFEEYSEIDIYNIYAPRCLKSSNSGVRTRDKLTDSQNKVIHFKVLILDPNFNNKISSRFDLNLTTCTCRSPGEQ